MSVSGNFSFNDNNMAVILRMALAWNFFYVLLSPAFVCVLCLGFRRRRPDSWTHSDVLTFNMAAFEMLGALGSAVNVAAYFALRLDLLIVGDDLCYVTTLGQALLHHLVASERYLAVVHPIVYLRWKKKGVAVRNSCIAVVWLFSLTVAVVYNQRFPLLNQFSVLIIGLFSLSFVSFFCASVFCVLLRPGPGERSGLDASKRRAFYTIAAIAAALMLKFVVMLASQLVFLSDTRKGPSFSDYLLAMAALWFYIPSSLVMPVIFLFQRIKRREISK